MSRRPPRARAAGLAALALAALVAAPACELEPDVGPPLEARCTGDDTDPDVDVSWSRDIAPIFARSAGGCAFCHDPAMPNALGVQLGGLDLSSYAGTLAGGARSGATIVVPGQPCASVLYQKLLPGPPFGGRMPLNGPPFLSTTELNLIHDWIAEGALED